MGQKIRSAIFRDVARTNEKFEKHLSHVWNLSDEQREGLLKSLPAIVRAETGTERAIAQANAVEAVGGDSRKVLEAINVLNYLYVQWDEKRDKSNRVLEEMRELGFLPTDEKSIVAEKFLQQFFAFVEQDNARRRRKVAANAVLPIILGLSAVVEHRAVFSSTFDWSTDELADYSPTCEDHVSVAVIRMRMDDNKEPVVFQCDRDDLKMMVKKLQSIIKEMDASKRFLKDGPSEESGPNA